MSILKTNEPTASVACQFLPKENDLNNEDSVWTLYIDLTLYALIMSWIS